MRYKAGQKPQLVPPQKMRQAVSPQGVQPGIADENLYDTSGCRVFGEHRLDIFFQGLEHDILSFFALIKRGTIAPFLF